MLRRRLAKHGYEMIVAEDGARGVEAAMRDMPDLILMDLSLPILSGWEAAQQLKRSDRTRSIPIIALSGHALEGERDKALAAGCDDFETKPVDLARLLEKLARLLLPGRDDGAKSVPHPHRRRCRRSRLHAGASPQAVPGRENHVGREWPGGPRELGAAAVRSRAARRADARNGRSGGARLHQVRYVGARHSRDYG